MSDIAAHLRIRVQPAPRDPDTLSFLLDAPIQHRSGIMRFDAPDPDAPLVAALFDVPGVCFLEVAGPAIHVRKTPAANWDEIKPAIAAAIRAVLPNTPAPLGTHLHREASDVDADARMLAAVRALLDANINPKIARHGGQITAERVTDSTVYLRMSGGCQGCAASQLTLRGGVERTLRSALPDVRAIIDVTDHESGSKPFYNADTAPNATRGGALRGNVMTLAERVRKHLETLPNTTPTTSYGAIARALGLWLPGSVRRVTRALEDTMHEDAKNTQPFIAARAISRATDGLPGKGFFDLARDLDRGPAPGEDDRRFHQSELARLDTARARDLQAPPMPDRDEPKAGSAPPKQA